MTWVNFSPRSYFAGMARRVARRASRCPPGGLSGASRVQLGLRTTGGERGEVDDAATGDERGGGAIRERQRDRRAEADGGVHRGLRSVERVEPRGDAGGGDRPGPRDVGDVEEERVG